MNEQAQTQTDCKQGGLKTQIKRPDMAAVARLQPLELVDKCIGSRIWIIMKVGGYLYIILP